MSFSARPSSATVASANTSSAVALRSIGPPPTSGAVSSTRSRSYSDEMGIRGSLSRGGLSADSISTRGEVEDVPARASKWGRTRRRRGVFRETCHVRGTIFFAVNAELLREAQYRSVPSSRCFDES